MTYDGKVKETFRRRMKIKGEIIDNRKEVRNGLKNLVCHAHGCQHGHHVNKFKNEKI